MKSELLAAFVAEVREHSQPVDEGTVWALFLDKQQRPLLVTQVSDRREEPRALAYLLANVGADAVVVGVVRRDGAPLEDDRRLYRALHTLLAGEPTRLLDGIVVGAYGWQSLTDEDDATRGVA